MVNEEEFSIDNTSEVYEGEIPDNCSFVDFYDSDGVEGGFSGNESLIGLAYIEHGPLVEEGKVAVDITSIKNASNQPISNLKKSNKAWLHFTGGVGKSPKDDLRHYDNWYDAQTLSYLVHSQPSSQILTFVTTQSGELQAPVIVCEEIKELAQLRTLLKKPIGFIIIEPNIFNSSHFIAGFLSVEHELLLVNPLGLTQHQGFYQELKKLNDVVKFKAIYLSTHKIQQDEKSVVSCGPICVELLRDWQATPPNLASFDIAQDKQTQKEELSYIAVEPPLPGNIIKLMERDNLKAITQLRQTHAELLKENTQEKLESTEDFWHVHCENMPLQVLVRRLLQNEILLANIEETLEYKQLKDLSAVSIADKKVVAENNKLPFKPNIIDTPYLNLRKQDVDDRQLELLCETLKPNKHIKAISLAHNKISRIECLLELLQLNPSIVALDLSYNDLDSTQIKLLANTIEKNKAFIALSIAGNKNAPDWEILLNTSLKVLDVSYINRLFYGRIYTPTINIINNKQLVYFAAANSLSLPKIEKIISKNTCIEHINVMGCFYSHSYINEYFKALNKNPNSRLRKLDLGTGDTTYYKYYDKVEKILLKNKAKSVLNINYLDEWLPRLCHTSNLLNTDDYGLASLSAIFWFYTKNFIGEESLQLDNEKLSLLIEKDPYNEKKEEVKNLCLLPEHASFFKQSVQQILSNRQEKNKLQNVAIQKISMPINFPGVIFDGWEIGHIKAATLREITILANKTIEKLDNYFLSKHSCFAYHDFTVLALYSRFIVIDVIESLKEEQSYLDFEEQFYNEDDEWIFKAINTILNIIVFDIKMVSIEEAKIILNEKANIGVLRNISKNLKKDKTFLWEIKEESLKALYNLVQEPVKQVPALPPACSEQVPPTPAPEAMPSTRQEEVPEQPLPLLNILEIENDLLNLANQGLHRLSPQQWLALDSQLTPFEKLSVNLSGNKLYECNSAQWQAIADVLSPVNIMSLDLSNNQLGNLTVSPAKDDTKGQWTALKEALAEIQPIKLDLSDNNLAMLQEDAWQSFCSIFTQEGLQKLAFLQLKGNQLEEKGKYLKRLFKALAKTQLIYLDLGENNRYNFKAKKWQREGEAINNDRRLILLNKFLKHEQPVDIKSGYNLHACELELPVNLECKDYDQEEQLVIDMSKPIGGGTSGFTYPGTWQNSTVAVKILNRQNIQVKEKKLIEREIGVLFENRHNNLLQITKALYDEKSYYLVMPRAKYSLAEYLKKNHGCIKGIVWEKRCLELALEIASGVMNLHSRNIIHRDLKSANILLTDNHKALVADFGSVQINRDYPDSFSEEVNVERLGTLQWLPPEIIKADRENRPCKYTEQTDVYSFGVLLWEIVTGKLSYDNIKAKIAEDNILKGELNPLPADTYTFFKDLIKECCSMDPAERPTIQQVADKLQAELALKNKEISELDKQEVRQHRFFKSANEASLMDAPHHNPFDHDWKLEKNIAELNVKPAEISPKINKNNEGIPESNHAAPINKESDENLKKAATIWLRCKNFR